MKKLLVVAALVAGAGVWGWGHHGGSKADEGNLVVDRLWIDHMPTSARDMVNVFIAFDGEAMGIFQKGSRWSGSYEMFHFELEGGQMRIAYPQTGKHEQVKVRAHSCDEAQMDYCLEIEGATRGVKKYYSMEGWELRSHGDVDALLQKIAP